MQKKLPNCLFPKNKNISPPQNKTEQTNKKLNKPKHSQSTYKTKHLCSSARKKKKIYGMKKRFLPLRYHRSHISCVSTVLQNHKQLSFILEEW